MLRTHQITRKFGTFTAVDTVDFCIPRGEITGFIGLNGAGKTTTIKMLSHLIKPSGGNIEYQGTDFNQCRERFLKNTGIMLENMAFYDEMTVYENLRWFGAFFDTNSSGIHESLEMTGIFYARDKLFSELSKGMKQRMALASAIMKNPDLLILDEPTSGLDPAGRYDIKNVLKKLKEDNKTVFLSTHLLEEAEDFCTHFVFIHKGKIAAEGGKELFRQRKCCIETENVVKALEILSKIEEVKNCVCEKEIIHFEAPAKLLQSINRILVDADVPVSSIKTERSLEEFFMRITG